MPVEKGPVCHGITTGTEKTNFRKRKKRQGVFLKGKGPRKGQALVVEPTHEVKLTWSKVENGWTIPR